MISRICPTVISSILKIQPESGIDVMLFFIKYSGRLHPFSHTQYLATYVVDYEIYEMHHTMLQSQLEGYKLYCKLVRGGQQACYSYRIQSDKKASK